MKLNIDKEMQQKILLGVVLYAIGFVVFNNIILSELGKKTKLMRQNLELQKLTYAQNMVKMSSIDKIKKEIELVKDEYKNKRKSFIKGNERKVLLSRIEEFGKKYGMKLETITLDTKAPLQPETPFIDEKGNAIDMTKYQEYIISMNFKSRYDNLVYYIEAIENLEEVVIVDSMDLSSNGTELNVRLVLKTFIVNDRGE